MKSSAWSSLVISASSAALALALAAPAGAHLSLTPRSTSAGADVDLTFAVPNEDDPNGVVRVTLGIPMDFELDDAEAKPGWTQSRAGQTVTWSAGRIPRGQYGTFGIRGTAPKRAETVLFNVLVGSGEGKTTTYRVGLNVKAHPQRDVGARTLGKAALIVAIGAAILALAGGFLALYVWLRPPPP
jgi:hypothetical protein